MAVQLYKNSDIGHSNSQMEPIASCNLKNNEVTKQLFLKIEADGSSYSFSYAFKPNKWNLLADGIGAKFLSTKVSGGFVGCMYALYATSSGRPSNNEACFDWFEYCGDDEVYKDLK